MSESSIDAERRASGPGARRVLLYTVGGFAVAGLIIGGIAVLRSPGSVPAASAQSAPPAASAARSNNTYGSLPAWLPKPTTSVGRVVQASAAHPWIAIEGDTVVVHMNGHTVDTTMVGPKTPPQRLFPVPKRTACTFLLTLTRASGSIPIVPSDFLIFDDRGKRFVPTVRLADGRPAPSVVGPGPAVTLRLHAVLPTGSGELVWTDGAKAPVVSFEFVTEID